MATTTGIYTIGDSRRLAILSGYDKRSRERSRKSYLTFEAAADNTTVTWTAPNESTLRTIEVSTDGGSTWTQKTSSTAGTSLGTINKGARMLVRGSAGYQTPFSQNRFSSDKDVYVWGNALSLVYGDNFIGQTVYTAAHGFRGLFKGMTTLLTDPKRGYIIFPMASIPQYGLFDTFNGCSKMTAPPVIDASDVSGYESCGYMFSGCSSLLTPPELPATTLDTYCYENMFRECVSLRYPPELPATTLPERCYNSMFYGCSSLTGAVEIPATTVGAWCCSQMFYGSGITEITLPAQTLAERCYNQMFRLCPNLRKITCLATDISATSCVDNWCLGMGQSSGTFVKAAGMTSWPSGASGIPTGWTVQDYTS